MKRKIILKLGVAFATLVFLNSCVKKGPDSLCNCTPDNIVINSSLFSTGFNSPRGLKFGPDGYLYVAEAGLGGTNTTTCTQVVPPVGPYLGSQTGSRISRVGQDGVRATFVDGLPSNQTAAGTGSLISGVADVAFIGNTLYGLLASAGCSHGVVGIPNQVFKVNHDRSWSLVADLSNYYLNNQTAVENPGDFEPDGTPYSMSAENGNLFVVEPNHGELDKVTLGGKIDPGNRYFSIPGSYRAYLPDLS